MVTLNSQSLLLTPQESIFYSGYLICASQWVYLLLIVSQRFRLVEAQSSHCFAFWNMRTSWLSKQSQKVQWSLVPGIRCCSRWPGFPGDSVGKGFACSAGGQHSIPVSGRSPGGGNGNPLQDSCWKYPTDREAWEATVPGVVKRVGHNLASKQQTAFYSSSGR